MTLFILFMFLISLKMYILIIIGYSGLNKIHHPKFKHFHFYFSNMATKMFEIIICGLHCNYIRTVTHPRSTLQEVTYAN